MVAGMYRRFAGVVVVAALSVAGCSSEKSTGERSAGRSGGSTGGASAQDVGMMMHGFANAPDAGAAATTTAHEDASIIAPGASECVGQMQSAQPVPLDMYLMVDRSDSMRLETGTGASKWDAMRSALTSFIDDPKSKGLGVGLQYFPLGVAGVPDNCGSDKECGDNGGTCANRVCKPPFFATTFTPVFCVSNADCDLGSACAPMGLCATDQTMACFNIGPTGCDTLGACVAIAGECTRYDSCVVADYSTPAVPIASLPKNATALTDSLTSEQPIGSTPTAPALSGAMDRAAMQAIDNPTHRVIAVLATDGLPTDCVTNDIQTVDQAVTAVAAIAATGFASSPSIATYVIGVFAPDDPDPMTKLDQLASAGGTDHAFIVDSSQDVSQQLIDALASIRSGTLNCELQLPDPPDGQKLDYHLVNVQFTSENEQHELLYVRSAAGCDKAELGWYYDVDPDAGDGTPTQIRVCDKTCNDFHDLSGDASVEIKLGCATHAPD
jgi:hypothetical protein